MRSQWSQRAATSTRIYPAKTGPPICQARGRVPTRTRPENKLRLASTEIKPLQKFLKTKSLVRATRLKSFLVASRTGQPRINPLHPRLLPRRRHHHPNRHRHPNRRRLPPPHRLHRHLRRHHRRLLPIRLLRHLPSSWTSFL